MTHSSLLVVGSVALDDVDGPFGRHPDVLGGSASFFSLAASYFLVEPKQIQVVAVIGDDFPAEHLAFLESRGVDLSGVEKAAGKTFRWRGRYSNDLATRETLDTQLGVFAGFEPKLSERNKSADFLFLGNIDPVLQLGVLEQVKKPRLVACDTMNFWIGGKPDDLRALVKRVDLLVVNDEEARQLAGMHSLVKAAAAIRAMGPKAVVVKRGDSGALLFHEDGTFAAPAFPLEDVRDPTGAGDTFAGGFMGYLARVGELSPGAIRRAMVYGSVMASFCVEDFSLDRMRTLTAGEIKDRFRQFVDLTSFENLSL
jgi:sugar/nucleoside kinase (ribokinase family)